MCTSSTCLSAVCFSMACLLFVPRSVVLLLCLFYNPCSVSRIVVLFTRAAPGQLVDSIGTCSYYYGSFPYSYLASRDTRHRDTIGTLSGYQQKTIEAPSRHHRNLIATPSGHHRTSIVTLETRKTNKNRDTTGTPAARQP